MASVSASACTNTPDQHTVTATTSTTLLTAPKVDVMARIKTYDPEFVDLFDNYVSWTEGTGSGLRQHRVMVHDLRTSMTTEVATASSDRTTIQWARGSRDTLVYIEEDNPEESSGKLRAPWRIVAIDLTTGDERVIDKPRNERDLGYTPTPVIDWPWLAWTRLAAVRDGGAYSDVVVTNLETGDTKTLAHDEAIHGTYITGTTVLAEIGTGTGTTTTIDVYAIDVVSGTRRQVSTSGKVYRAGKASGDFVAWEETETGDPVRVMAAPIAGGDAFQLAGPARSNVVAGDGFAAWFADERVEVGALRPNPRPVVAGFRKSIPVRLSVDGNRLAWGEQVRPDGDFNEVEIVVATVSVEG